MSMRAASNVGGGIGMLRVRWPQLLRSELRKIVSTHTWWVLLLVTVALCGLSGLGLGSLLGLPDLAQTLLESAPVGLLIGPGIINVATLAGLLLGALASSSEFRSGTVTTSVLTSSSRLGMLLSKVLVHLPLALAYGVLAVAATMLGLLAGYGTDALPGFGSALALLGAGVLGMVLWTVVGLGLGTVITNQTVLILTLVLYTFPGEAILGGLLQRAFGPGLVAWLPNSAGSQMLSTLGIELFRSSGGNTRMLAVIDTLFGQQHSLPWWGSAVVLAGWTGIALTAGLWRLQRRDLQ